MATNSDVEPRFEEPQPRGEAGLAPPPGHPGTNLCTICHPRPSGENQKRISGGQSNEFQFQIRFEFQVSVGESGKMIARVGSVFLQGAAMGEEHLHVDLLMTTMTMMTTMMSE